MQYHSVIKMVYHNTDEHRGQAKASKTTWCMLPSRACPKKTNKSTETRSSYCLPRIGCDVYIIA